MDLRRVRDTRREEASLRERDHERSHETTHLGEEVKTVVLQRMESSDEGTFGILYLDGVRLFTGELPWRDNDNNTSCIPAGKYKAVMTFSSRFRKRLYLVAPVENRAGIRIHPANRMGDKSLGYVSELLGCIALGEKIGWINKQKAVLLSMPAVRRLERYMKNQAFILEIKDVVAA